MCLRQKVKDPGTESIGRYALVPWDQVDVDVGGIFGLGIQRDVHFDGLQDVGHRARHPAKERAQHPGLLRRQIRDRLGVAKRLQHEPADHRDRLERMLQPPERILENHAARRRDLSPIRKAGDAGIVGHKLHPHRCHAHARRDTTYCTRPTWVG